MSDGDDDDDDDDDVDTVASLLTQPPAVRDISSLINSVKLIVSAHLDWNITIGVRQNKPSPHRSAWCCHGDPIWRSHSRARR